MPESPTAYPYHLLGNIAQFLSAGMSKLNSPWRFEWNPNTCDFKAINETEKCSLELHLRNISGAIANQPDFNMSIFPTPEHGAGNWASDLSSFKFVPEHGVVPWAEPCRVSDSLLNDVLINHGVGTLDDKSRDIASFGSPKTNGLAHTNTPKTNFIA